MTFWMDYGSLLSYYIISFCVLILGSLVGGGGVFESYINSTETGSVFAVYIIFHLFDGLFAFRVRHWIELKCVRLKVLQFQFCMAFLGFFLPDSTIIKCVFGTWASLSFIHWFIVVSQLLCQVESVSAFQSRAMSLKTQINDNIKLNPRVVTYCEMVEPKPIWKFWKMKHVVWSVEKIFDYKYCIDLSQIDHRELLKLKENQNVVEMIDFDIRFDDEETEISYQRNIQTFLNELPEILRNGEIKTKRIIRMSDVNIEKGIVLKSQFYKWISLIMPVINVWKIYQWLIIKLDIKPLLRKVTITKMISDKDIEVI
ncbi:uncharacterized protein [Clytia hemisphaerica]|uniref:Uncharacterized protein n=1 Tax=Clytia hemisphaerica TaxID=252671 RepID=A0A7M5WZ23_9CNID